MAVLAAQSLPIFETRRQNESIFTPAWMEIERLMNFESVLPPIDNEGSVDLISFVSRCIDLGT